MKRMVQFACPGQARNQVGRIGQNQSCKVVRNDKDRCESHSYQRLECQNEIEKEAEKVAGPISIWACAVG
jgi:hypothetical protein